MFVGTEEVPKTRIRFKMSLVRGVEDIKHLQSEEDDTDGDDGGIVHVVGGNGKVSGEREYDAYEDRPHDTDEVTRPPEDAISHIEWTWLEYDVGVGMVKPS